MVNHKPVAGDLYVPGFDPLAPVLGNILDATPFEDIDGDLVRLNFVNEQRITRSNDPNANPVTVIVGEHGTLTIDARGNFSYELDPTDPAVMALDPGEVLIEQFTFKISDGRGATDFGVMDIAIDVPERGAYTIDFEDAGRDYPEGYKGFVWGPLWDGDQMPLRTEAGGNTYIGNAPYFDVIMTVDGHDVVIEDFELATTDGTTAVVTFEGVRDGNSVGTQTVTVSGSDLDTSAHVSLAGLGAIDELHIDFEFPDYDGDFTDYPGLKFDDFLVTA
jgi:autoaggregation protein RapA/B/C